MLTGGAGILTFLLVWVEQPTLPEGATGAGARRFLESSMSSIELSVLAQTVGFTAVLVFVIGIHWLMRRAETPGRLLSDLALLSGGLLAVWFWLQASIDALPLVLADDTGKLAAYSDSSLLILEPLSRLGETIGDLATVPRAGMALAVSLLALRTRFAPRWIGYVGMVVAVVSLLGLLGASAVPVLGGALLLGLFAFFLWVLLLSISLIVPAVRRPHDR